MSQEERTQPENEELVNLNADNLDADQLDEIEDQLDDVSGGGCGNNSCWIYSDQVSSGE